MGPGPQIYKYRKESKRVPIKVNSNLSLYEACKRTVGIDGGIVIEGKGRLVAFWCSHQKIVKAGFGATPDERSHIKNYLLCA